MNLLHRLTAWLARKSRTRERRKLYRELIKIGRQRAKFPERHHQFFAETTGILARLDAIALADDIAGVEARIKPVPLSPELPTEGRRLRVVREGQQ